MIIPGPASCASLLSASNFGGSQYDVIRAVTTDAVGNIYVVGETYSNDFPAAKPSIHSRTTGDAFVVKLSATGTQILYSLVFGGSSYDSARGLSVDSAGNAYITGITDSYDFPVSAGALQARSASPGLQDAFVAKVNAAGTLVYATYLGGSSNDAGYGIAVDQYGAAFVTGATSSQNFPVTYNAPQLVEAGISNCFIAKLDPGGATLTYATFLGGRGIDLCRGIALDGAGNAFVTGITNSSNFPVTGAINTALSGSSDAFLAKLSPAGDRWLFSTYIGGESVDEGNAVTIGPNGLVYVAGASTSSTFGVPNASQNQNRGSYDGFLCAIVPDGSQLLWARYIGGSGSDSATALSVAQDGRIVVAGFTGSADFPLVTPIQSTFGGLFDAFVSVVDANGSALDFSTFIGGGQDDRAYGVVSAGTNEFIVAGQILSGSVSYLPELFSSPPGQYDGFFALISYSPSTIPLRFVPIIPCRVADTRPGHGFTGGFGPPALPAFGTRTFPIPSSNCGIPITAQAYSLSITAVPPGPLGYLTVWPAGQARPRVSTLNSDGRIKANAAIIPAGLAGGVSIFVSDATELVLDIDGYFIPASSSLALEFFPLPPCPVSDTRTLPGVLGGPSLAGGSTRTFPILFATACGIPSSAQAYLLNFTAFPGGPLGYMTAWPTGIPRPKASTLNASSGAITSAAAILAGGISGSIDVFVSDDTDLSIEISGYFASPAAGGLSLYSIVPCRLLDTRYPLLQPPLPGGITYSIDMSASSCQPPASAQAYVVNATVVPPGPLQYLNIWASAAGVPSTPTLRAPDGAITSNMTIVPATNGIINALPSDPTHLIVDLMAYFAP
ncbi:MAG: SBBP repeat-containing protein [Bryobacterales bacterium]|nr:SBBP repeat-containing protein [Bryobacterales bacterium]